MLSSALGPGSAAVPNDVGALSGNAFACGVCAASEPPVERAAASSEADDSGTGEAAGAEASGAFATTAGGGGAAGGTGSLARGALTEVSPVNGFLYSVCGVMTSRAVGL